MVIIWLEHEMQVLHIHVGDRLYPLLRGRERYSLGKPGEEDEEKSKRGIAWSKAGGHCLSERQEESV